jgi:anti-sigma B factor antagonist
MEDKHEVEISSQQDVTVVSFRGSSISDVDKIAIASRQINEFISKNQPLRMVFDFSGVKFFCSRVLGLLLEIRAKLEAYGGQVVISGIDPQLYRVFKITNLDKIFRFFPDMGNAVVAMKSSQA